MDTQATPSAVHSVGRFFVVTSSCVTRSEPDALHIVSSFRNIVKTVVRRRRHAGWSRVFDCRGITLKDQGNLIDLLSIGQESNRSEQSALA